MGICSSWGKKGRMYQLEGTYLPQTKTECQPMTEINVEENLMMFARRPQLLL
jgi:hypothetical protein